MLKIAVLGAGDHSQRNHLPALQQYMAAHPGEIELAALCDLRRAHAETVAAQYGFERVYTDLDQMLRAEQPDACLAITPIPATLPVALTIIRARVPLLMEKPPGATVSEARTLVDLVERVGTPTMVSMNRRFDPFLCAALHWQADRPLVYLCGSIIRHNRREPEFMTGTAIHALDAMRAIAGDVSEFRVEKHTVDGVRWYIIHLRFVGGTAGLLQVLPTGGAVEERYEGLGADWRFEAQAGDWDRGGVCGWQNGQVTLSADPARGQLSFVRNGTWAETVAFIQAVRDGLPMYPTPAQVLQSVELCHAIAEA